jgi:hypothetical protein
MIVTRFRALATVAALALILGACVAPSEQQAPKPPRVSATAAPVPPVAAKKAYLVTAPNGARQDEYYWLRDDTRQSQEMLAYLNAENAYRDAVMAHTDALRHSLYEELVGRLQPDEASVRYSSGVTGTTRVTCRVATTPSTRGGRTRWLRPRRSCWMATRSPSVTSSSTSATRR